MGAAMSYHRFRNSGDRRTRLCEAKQALDAQRTAQTKKVTFAQASVPGGYHVKWRYVTLDGKWVLVQDSDADHHNDGYATVNWWFVRRSAFDVLCTHPRLTDPPVVGPACAPTN
jgi:hypothetical protein